MFMKEKELWGYIDGLTTCSEMKKNSVNESQMILELSLVNNLRSLGRTKEMSDYLRRIYLHQDNIARRF